MTDIINHPPHYTSHPSGLECIEITRHMGYNLGNAMAYIWRADHKGSPITDLEKAVWHIQDEIRHRRKLETAKSPSKMAGTVQDLGTVGVDDGQKPDVGTIWLGQPDGTYIQVPGNHPDAAP